MRILAAVILIPLCISSLTALEVEDTDIHLKIVETESAGPPEIIAGQIFLSYKPEHSTRFVGAAFAHEDFGEIHTFRKNEHGVYILLYPIPEKLDVLKYRLAVDGLWISDPNNDQTVEDQKGIRISCITLPQEESGVLESPKFNSNGTVTFSKEYSPGKTVYITGNFNNWDPFMHRMKEIKSGLYRITLPLNTGTHYYYFISEGNRLLDDLNSQIAANANGQTVSYFHFSSNAFASK